MLWDIIRDFIVEHITGGMNSGGDVFVCNYGFTNFFINGEYDDGFNMDGNMLFFKVGNGYYGGSNYVDAYISASDWLATTFTIIAMCLIVAFAIWLVRWVFKAVSSAFLLRR